MRHAALILFVLIAAGIARASDPRPHILLVMADDLGWNDVGFHDSPIRTPVIDRLAREGIRCEAFYSQPVCLPARAALMTGRYPVRFGLVHGNTYADGEGGLRRDAVLLPELLGRQGYRTAILGKWHLGMTAGYRPEDRGFDYQYGGYLGSLDYFTHRRGGRDHWFRNGALIEQQGYLTDLVAEEARALIQEHDARQPLFLYVPFNAPHTPLQAPQDRIDAYADLTPEKRRIYAAMVTSMDTAIGVILTALEKKEMRKNTLVIFLSDNGGSRRHGADNSPFRGGKGTAREGGLRVPAVFHWPGVLKPGRSDQLAHIVDLLPTVLARAGAADLPEGLDGHDLWPLLTAGAPSPHEELLLVRRPSISALRRGDWKLIVRGDRTEDVQLFNIRTDPAEATNLSDAHPERVAELRARIGRYPIPAPRTGIERRPRRGKAGG